MPPLAPLRGPIPPVIRFVRDETITHQQQVPKAAQVAELYLDPRACHQRQVPRAKYRNGRLLTRHARNTRVVISL